MPGRSTPDNPAGSGVPGKPRPTERTDAPHYLARYLDRQRTAGEPAAAAGPDGDAAPLYLRRFRGRRHDPDTPMGNTVSYQGQSLGVPRAWAEITRTKELAAPLDHPVRTGFSSQVHLVRHGETQGYSTESGLTPLGGWQSHRRGFDLSKGVRSDERVRIVCADTNRARQTAEHLHRGLLDGLVQWGRDADVADPRPMAEFNNFGVATPSGVKDVTAAFREYQAVMERHERMASGDRPLWMVEIDRFWTTQQGGGDPIYFWLTIPMLHFEPPASCVRRFWSGIGQVLAETPDAKIIVATHSGPIRAFATWAVGYDPGEPYNTEEVLVRIVEGGTGATVAYRNRVQEVQVPPLSALPDWWAKPGVEEGVRG
jgi:broad specificity phosphatase PhoE